jgi:lysophospholipase L1-like esterase
MGALLTAGLLAGAGVGAETEQDQSALFSRSLVSLGDASRIQAALAKARKGQAVTIGVIGGSITQGAGASKPENRYGDRVAEWWRKTFPTAKVRFVNAGIGATGSSYGALRARRDLLSQQPDFVMVEYAVNDPNEKSSAETLEGLARQILREPNHPAVVLLFTMNQNGGNTQEWHAQVGRHYGLPMVSFRDALWPEIQAGRLKWSDVEADSVHPNDRGHDYAAQFVTRLLGSVLKDLPAGEVRPETRPLPKPLFSDLFEHVTLQEAEVLKPLASRGWSYDGASPWSKGWKSDTPGSALELEIEGTVVLIMDWHIRGPMGKAKVQVDNLPPVVRDGWFDQTWGGYRQTTELARNLPPGKHRVRIELLEEKNPQSSGREFRVMGLGAAGVKEERP